MEFRTSIGIDAFADDAWHVLTDTRSWPEWNKTVDRVIGKLALNQQIKVYSSVDTKRIITVRVTELARPSRMVWEGGLPFGLFTVIRTFSLNKGIGSFNDLTVQEKYSGLLLPFVRKHIPNLQPSIDEFAICLKRRIES